MDTPLYTYRTIELSDPKELEEEINKLCARGKSRVISSNAYFDNHRNATYYYAVIQTFRSDNYNPDYQMLKDLDRIKS